MKLYNARNRPSHRNNKQKRRWYTKVRWTYEKIDKWHTENSCRGAIKYGQMYVVEKSTGVWFWSVTAEMRNSWYRGTREGFASSRILAQRRALDACRKMIGLEYLD